MHQTRYVDKLARLAPDATFQAFRTLRHKLAWASHCRPDILASVNILAQVTETAYSPRHLEKINGVINHLQRNRDIKIRFVNLDRDTLQLLVFCDGSFATNDDLSSQTGYVILLADKHKKANIIQYASSKTKRIVCLLYTSPSPRDQRGSRMPSSA